MLPRRPGSTTLQDSSSSCNVERFLKTLTRPGEVTRYCATTLRLRLCNLCLCLHNLVHRDILLCVSWRLSSIPSICKVSPSVSAATCSDNFRWFMWNQSETILQSVLRRCSYDFCGRSSQAVRRSLRPSTSTRTRGRDHVKLKTRPKRTSPVQAISKKTPTTLCVMC